MKEIFNNSVSLWNSYWNHSIFLVLFIAGLVWLFLFRRKEKYVRRLLAFTGILLFVYICPLTAGVIQKCIGSTVYWRVLWLVPAVPVQAAAAAELLKDKKGIRSILITAVMLAAVLAGGKGFLKEGYFKKVNNYQQVPDEAAGICELIKNDADGSAVYLAADDYIGSYVRVYDASLKMPYGRRGSGVMSWNAYYLYQAMNAPVVDCSEAGELAEKCRVGYLVIKIPADEQKEILKEYGYQEVGVVGSYAVFGSKNSG